MTEILLELLLLIEAYNFLSLIKFYLFWWGDLSAISFVAEREGLRFEFQQIVDWWKFRCKTNAICSHLN